MDNFIIRHKMMLQSLVLDSYVDEWAVGPQRTWSDIWSRFGIELDKLRDLAVRWNIDADIPDEHKQFENTRYFVLDLSADYVHRGFHCNQNSANTALPHSNSRGRERRASTQEASEGVILQE